MKPPPIVTCPHCRGTSILLPFIGEVHLCMCKGCDRAWLAVFKPAPTNNHPFTWATE